MKPTLEEGIYQVSQAQADHAYIGDIYGTRPGQVLHAVMVDRQACFVQLKWATDLGMDFTRKPLVDTDWDLMVPSSIVEEP